MGDEPVITAAGIAAGHDGQAEIAVAVAYPNGARRTITLPATWLAPALDAAGIDHLDQLVGRPWTVLLAGTRSPGTRSPGTTDPADTGSRSN